MRRRCSPRDESGGEESVDKERQTPSDLPPRDVATWLDERRADAERRLEEICQKAIARLRAVAAEEIRVLSRRVEKMHQALDQLEQRIEKQAEGENDGGDDERAEREDPRDPD